MTPYRKLVISAITLVSSQEGEVSDRMLASHATSIVATVCVAFAFAAFSFSALFVPELARVGREHGKWISLLTVVVIWLLQFSSVRCAAKNFLEGKCMRVSKTYAVWSVVAAICTFFSSIAATLAFR